MISKNILCKNGELRREKRGGGDTHEQYIKNVYIVVNKMTAFSVSRSDTHVTMSGLRVRAECAQ